MGLCEDLADAECRIGDRKDRHEQRGQRDVFCRETPASEDQPDERIGGAADKCGERGHEEQVACDRLHGAELQLGMLVAGRQPREVR